MSENIRIINKLIEYKASVILDEDGVYTPVYLQHSVEGTYIKRYKGVLYKLCNLKNGCDRDLIDFLVEIMDKNNIVYNVEEIKKQFINYIRDATKDSTSKEYRFNTIDRAFGSLVEKRLLIWKGRSRYMVNPEYFWRASDEKKRLEVIKIEMEFDYQSEANDIIVKTDEDRERK